MPSPNSDPTPAAVTVTLAPFTVEVHEVELETSVSVPCSGTYADAPGSAGVVCSDCGDFSNSEPGLRCGRVD